jgi:hypothetical protein
VRFAQGQGFKTVALPSIGAGKSSFRPLRLAAQSLNSSIRRFVQTQFKLRTSEASGRMLQAVNAVPCKQSCGPAVQPNPSLKGRSNGVPPSPGHRVAFAHFLWPGLGVPPSASPLVQTLGVTKAYVLVFLERNLNRSHNCCSQVLVSALRARKEVRLGAMAAQASKTRTCTIRSSHSATRQPTVKNPVSVRAKKLRSQLSSSWSARRMLPAVNINCAISLVARSAA